MEDKKTRDREMVRLTLLRLDEQFGISRRFPDRRLIVQLVNDLIIFRNNEEGHKDHIVIPAMLILESERAALLARQAEAESRNLFVTFDTATEKRHSTTPLNENGETNKLDGAIGGVDAGKSEADGLRNKEANLELKLDKAIKRFDRLEKEIRNLHKEMGDSRAELKEYADVAADKICEAAYVRTDSHRQALEEKITDIIQMVEALKTMKQHNQSGPKKEEKASLAAVPRERCYNCGELDHKAASCKKPGLLCYRCRQYEGHTSVDCPYTDEEVARFRRGMKRYENTEFQSKNSSKRKNQNESQKLDAKRQKFDEVRGRDSACDTKFNQRANSERGRGRGQSYRTSNYRGHKGTNDEKKKS